MVAKLVLMAVKCNFSAEKSLTDLRNNALTISAIKITNLTISIPLTFSELPIYCFYMTAYQRVDEVRAQYSAKRAGASLLIFARALDLRL